MSNKSNKPAVWFPTIRAGSGTDVFTERLAKGLVARGLKAYITWLPHRAEYLPWAVEMPKCPDWANIVHVNTWLPSRFLPFEIPIIATVHHCIQDKNFIPYKNITQKIYHHLWITPNEKRVIREATRLIAVSKYTAGHVRQGFACDMPEVIPNGVDAALFCTTLQTKPNRPFRLLFVGNWSRRKGTDLLRPIMKELGEGFELKTTLGRRAASANHNLESNIHVVPSPPDDVSMSALYTDCDALLFPSRLEGFGLVALEAQACGLPVIATNCSALTEVIEDGITGILCPQDDVAAFATAARRLAENTDIWLKMREAARRRVEEFFSMDLMLDRYIDTYCLMLNGS